MGAAKKKSARKRVTAKESGASESLYRKLFQTTREGVLIVDFATGKIIEANPFMSDLLGYTREEFLGREVWEVGFFKDYETSQEAFRELRTNPSICYSDLR